MTIYTDGFPSAKIDETGLFVLTDQSTTNKNKQLIELLNKSPNILKRIRDNILTIYIDTSKYNPLLKGIAPGYVLRRSGDIYALESLSLFFLFIVVAFESVNYNNRAFTEIFKNRHHYKSTDDFARAYEIAEFETYKEALHDMTHLYKNGVLTAPWYIPFTTDKNSFLGWLIKALSKILPAKFMIRYLAPMDVEDWLQETDRKPWYFFGETHADGYRSHWKGPYPTHTDKLEPVLDAPPISDSPPALMGSHLAFCS